MEMEWSFYHSGMGMGMHSESPEPEWEWECIPDSSGWNGNGNAFRKFPEWTDICGLDMYLLIFTNFTLCNMHVNFYKM